MAPEIQACGWAGWACEIRKDFASFLAWLKAALLRGFTRGTAACGPWAWVKFVVCLQAASPAFLALRAAGNGAGSYSECPCWRSLHLSRE